MPCPCGLRIVLFCSRGVVACIQHDAQYCVFVLVCRGCRRQLQAAAAGAIDEIPCGLACQTVSVRLTFLFYNQGKRIEKQLTVQSDVLIRVGRCVCIGMCAFKAACVRRPTCTTRKHLRYD